MKSRRKHHALGYPASEKFSLLGGLEAVSCVPNRGGRASTAKREIVRGKKKVERLVGLLHLADSLSVSGNTDCQIAQPNHLF